MYHFVSEQTAELRLSENVLISSHTTQYLKCFQLEAVRFLYERLSKQEFCIFNDESGLGKSAPVVALLNGLGISKKTLIVLQNDEQLLAGWQFHLGVLSDLPVCVIKDVNDSTDSAHSVYLSKWSVLRSIGDLSKLNFDYIIVDHRGYTLNNNFCTSMLLKQFERKVNIVISSVDITSDVKLLYNVMSLGGCLEHQHKSFRSFERKFHLPAVKEVLSKRVDLEEYYKQRGVLGEYIKDFRLRRYRHQFDSYLPLVTPEQYKRNLTLWLGQNNSNSILSGSTIDSTSTGGTDEILECLMSTKRDRQLAPNQQMDPDKISLSEHSDEVIAMEPLVFEMSESEPEVEVTHVTDAQAKESNTNVVMLSSDDCEIVTPTITPTHSALSATNSKTSKTKRKYTKRAQTAKSAELTDSEAEEQRPTPKIKGKKLNVRLSRVCLPQKDLNIIAVTNSHKPKEQAATNSHKPKEQASKPGQEVSKKPPEEITPLEIKLLRAKPNNKVKLDPPVKPTPEPQTPKDDKPKPLPITPKTEPRSKRTDANISTGVQLRETRGMQRMTRSADARPYSKYMGLRRTLDNDKKVTPKRKRNSDTNQTPTTSKLKKVEVKQEVTVTAEKSKTTPTKGNPKTKKIGRAPKRKLSKEPKSLPSNKRRGKISEVTVKSAPAATPELLSSGSLQSDNSYLQCAQKLPENLAELGSLELPQFRVPHVPPATPLMLPIPLNLFSDSEVAIAPSPQQKSDVVVINSSHDESSQPSAKQSQSRRTRALKRKRPAPSKEQQSQPTTSSFGMLLAQQRGSVNKSPDIFSNCSDLSQLTLAQPVPSVSPFEGFKIFGSEVKQLQQQHAKTQAGMPVKKKRERSCLDILEQMFEPQNTKNSDLGVQLLPNLPSPKQQLPPRRFTLLDDDIFEITNNGEFGSRLRLDSMGNVSPVQQQQSQPQRNKITNYLISSGGTPEDAGQRTQASQVLRKSPKSIKSTQSTKLTRWFATAAAVSGESQSAPSTPVVPTDKMARARMARSGGAGKRKRLQLDK
ncbi:protein suppressor of underreplication [Drosophila virilis]|uniref:protein suppressor of underreplication n=1 Tax=Drosophila virilis TaxID=7244 RepID=UPI00017D2FC4|nr:protein suppressor of underreplication [Drosophila virilis]